MSLTAQMLALVRRGSRSAFTDGVYQAEINTGGDLLVAQALPPHAELTRLNVRWSVRVADGAAFAPVAAWPTTLANLVLYNGEAAGGKSYIIDTVWAASKTDIGAATSMVCLAQISNAGVAAPTDSATTLITGTAGKIYGGSAKKAVANSAFAITNKWTVIGQSSGHVTGTVAAGMTCNVDGRFIVVPGACFCVNLVASTAGGTMIQGIDWYEVQLDLGT